MVNAIASQVSTTNARIYAYIAQGIKKHSQFTPAQQVMAKHLGLTIDQTQKGLYWLRDKGIVSIHYRGWKEFNGYSINAPYTSYSFRKIIFDRIRFFHRLALPAWALLAPTQISSPTEGVLLNIKGDIYKTVSVTVSVRESISNGRKATKTERTQEVEEYFEQIKARDFMNEAKNPIPQYIRDIQALSLTKWGQIKLCAFPESAIRYAESKITGNRNVKEPYGLFFKLCLEYCKAADIAPNFMTVDILKATYNMPLNAPMLLEQPKMQQSNAKSFQKREDAGFFQELATQLERVSQENPFEAALKLERYYAHNPKAAAIASRINPWMHKLSVEDQESIRALIEIEFIDISLQKQENSAQS